MPGGQLRIALIVGEPSGDQLGAGLMDALRRIRPDAEFAGLAGERMLGRGMQSIFPISEIAVMGIGSVLLRLPRIVRRVHETVDTICRAAPDALVIVDSPDFTHAVARRVARAQPNLPIIDYVSPSVWAWRSGRAARMSAYVDHVLALLPFEPAAHARLGGPRCTYVGHPLVERLGELRSSPGERRPIGDRPVLLVLPGSRQTEIDHLMKPFGEAVQRIAQSRPDAEFVLPAVAHLRKQIERLSAHWPIRPRIVHGEAAKFVEFRRAHAAIAASGTVTLELGLAGVPMVVAYRVDPLLRPFKRFLKAPSIVLANLVLGANEIPEYLDAQGSPAALAAAALPLLAETQARKRQLSALVRLQEEMAPDDGKSPSARAAEIVVALAEQGRGARIKT